MILQSDCCVCCAGGWGSPNLAMLLRKCVSGLIYFFDSDVQKTSKPSDLPERRRGRLWMYSIASNEEEKKPTAPGHGVEMARRPETYDCCHRRRSTRRPWQWSRIKSTNCGDIGSWLSQKWEIMGELGECLRRSRFTRAEQWLTTHNWRW